MKNTAAWKRKQVPEGYLIIGVDPHKKKHAAVAIAHDFTIRDRFKFDNTREGLSAVTPRPEFKPFFDLRYEGLSHYVLKWRPRGDSNP